MVNFPTLDIAGSGLAAERYRMEVPAYTIANAGTTMTKNGDQYRRQAVVFSADMDESAIGHAGAVHHGVQVVGVEPDPTEFPTIYNPSHPHAAANGFVRLSNV